MKTREWQRIEQQASLDAFLLWLIEQPDTTSWARGDCCCCPLHDFIEATTGKSLSINSPELSEHWGERETQSWPTPWWMTWLIRSVDHTGSRHERITRDQLLSIALVMIERDFESPLMSAKEWLSAA